ncbi:MAG TPA: 50S ribosomal protein L18 [Patescibacteria group bacterium]|nr:50S ribosomal protein L18 [Patescibacteria group bacterium]
MKRPKRKNLDRPRISVFRSNQYIYAQIIDDAKGVTLVSASDHGLDKKQKKTEAKTTKGKDSEKGEKAAESQKMQKAFAVGKLLAERAQKKGIKKVWFHRGRYKYHGRLKALAEAARAGGLEF